LALNQDLKKQAQSCTFAKQDGTLVMVVEEGRTTLDLLKKPDMVIDSKYRVESLIGEGGMGAVYRAHHLLLQKYVALKTFRTNNLTEEGWQRFRREAQSIARLKHKNIVEVFDFGIAEDNLPYYTMSLLQGESLDARLEREKCLDVEDALEIFLQVAEALLHAHANNIVHRDIKPANIFLDKSHLPRAQKAQVKIVDFGIAKLAEDGTGNPANDEAQSLTVKGTVFGSPLYMSPEQINGQAVDQRSDIYSFGCALFESLAGEPPFKKENALATMLCHLQKEPPSLRLMLGEKVVSQRLDRLVSRMLAKEASRRYQSFSEVIEELKVCIQAKAAIKARAGASDFEARDEESKVDHSGGENAVVLPPAMPSTGLKVAAASVVAGLLVISLILVFNRSQIAIADKTSHAQSVTSEPEPSDLIAKERAAAVKDSRKFLVKKDATAYVFEFPKYDSFGSLSLFKKAKQRCVGEVVLKITPNPSIQFEAGDEFSINPSLFRRFGAHDLQYLELGNATSPWKVSVFEDLLPLTGLTGLTIHSFNIDNAAISYLEKFPFLRILDISNTSVDCAEVARSKILMQELCAITVNGLSHASALTGPALLYSDHSHLAEFCANNCGLLDSDLKNLAQIKSLQNLEVAGGNFSVSGIQYLAKHSNVVSLSLRQNNLSFEDLCQIPKFKNLRVLTVDLEKVTAEKKHILEAHFSPAEVQIHEPRNSSEQGL